MVEPPIDREWRWALRLTIIAILLALMVLFIAENYMFIEVRLVTRSIEARLAWVVLTAGGIGLLVGLLLPRPWRRDTPSSSGARMRRGIRGGDDHAPSR